MYKYMCLSWLKQQAKWLLIAAVEWKVKVKVNLFIVGCLSPKSTEIYQCEDLSGKHFFFFFLISYLSIVVLMYI